MTREGPTVNLRCHLVTDAVPHAARTPKAPTIANTDILLMTDIGLTSSLIVSRRSRGVTPAKVPADGGVCHEIELPGINPRPTSLADVGRVAGSGDVERGTVLAEVPLASGGPCHVEPERVRSPGGRNVQP